MKTHRRIDQPVTFQFHILEKVRGKILRLDPDRRFVEKTIHVLDMPTHGYCGLAGRQEVM